LLISVLITLSAWPLVAQSAQVLLQRTPHMLADGRRDECLAQLSRVHGVQVRARTRGTAPPTRAPEPRPLRALIASSIRP